VGEGLPRPGRGNLPNGRGKLPKGRSLIFLKHIDYTIIFKPVHYGILKFELEFHQFVFNITL